MSRVRTLLAFLLFAGAGFAAHRSVVPATEAVRSVDIGRILDEYQPLADRFQQMRSFYQARGQALSERADQLRAQQGELQQLDEHSSEYQRRRALLQVAQQALEQEAEYWAGEQRRATDALLAEGVRMVHEACAVYGERSGVSAILMQPGDLPELDGTGQAIRDLENRWVIWTHPDHDVTDEVLAVLREIGPQVGGASTEPTQD